MIGIQKWKQEEAAADHGEWEIREIEMKAIEIQDRRGKLKTLGKVKLTRLDNALDIWNERKE